jgi:hypothetical protein
MIFLIVLFDVLVAGQAASAVDLKTRMMQILVEGARSGALDVALEGVLQRREQAASLRQTF